MLELHDCIYCGQPLVINKTSGKVFNISCGHFNQELMFYVVQGLGGEPAGVHPVGAEAAAGVVHHATATATAPVQAVNYADMWGGDDEEEDE